jgi:hypothetical protein
MVKASTRAFGEHVVLGVPCAPQRNAQMTASNFCPQCGTPRVGSLRYCASCQYDYWGAAVSQTSSAPLGSSPAQVPPTATPTTPSPQPEPATGFPWGGTIVAVLVLAIVVLGGYALLNNRADQILNDVGDALASINPGGNDANVPPAGAVWFGSSFDPDTLAVRGRTTSVGAQEAFAVVGHLTRSMDGSQVNIRMYLDGSLLATNALGGTGSSELWGFSPSPLFQPGEWRYEFTDVGGNVLASGTVTATGGQ